MKGMGLLVSWNTVITEEPVWFLGTFILLLSSPPVRRQMKEFVFCCGIFGAFTFLEVLCGEFIHVCCEWGGTATLLYQHFPIMCILYSLSLQVNGISFFLCRLQKNILRFPFHLLSISVHIFLLLLSFSWLLLSSPIRNVFDWGNRNY
jgi:hypothetical protein